MLNKKIAFALLFLSSQYAFAQQAEKTILTLNSPESLSCGDKVFSQHVFKLTATQLINDDGSLDTSKTKIYEDGVLKGICKTELRKIAIDNSYDDFFTNLEVIKELSDQEVIKLFTDAYVGYCNYFRVDANIETYKTKSKVAFLGRDRFKALLSEKSIELETSDNETVLAAVLRDLVKQKKCGIFSKEITDAMRERNLQHLALSDVGFDYLIGQKVTKEELLKAKFSAKKLAKEFSIPLQEFKKYKYTTEDLSNSGFSSVDLYKAGFPLSELLNTKDISELKPIVSIQNFVSAGAGITKLKQIGFNESKEIKIFFNIEAFKAVYKDTYNPHNTVINLKRVGFTAKEIKEAGFGISVLKMGGFDEIQDLKPIFTIEEFQVVYKDTYNPHNTVIGLKRLGYSIKEIKDLGFGISTLKLADYDEIKEIKPLFTIADFKAVYNDKYNPHNIVAELKRLGYLIKDIKDLGFGITTLRLGGFDEVKDIKPLFTITDFKDVYNDRYNPHNTVAELKRLGYLIKDIKALGFSITSLRLGGFDEVKDIKPLFTITDFKNIYNDTYNPHNTVAELKRLGYLIKDIKDLGFGITTLRLGGFNEVKDIKPLFTITDFKAVYNDRYNPHNTVAELRRLEFSKEEVKALGFSDETLKAGGF